MDNLNVLSDIVCKIFTPRKLANTTNQGLIKVGEEESQWLYIPQHSTGSNILTLTMIFFETFKLLDIFSLLTLNDSEVDERCTIKEDKHNASGVLTIKNISSSWCTISGTYWKEGEHGDATHCYLPSLKVQRIFCLIFRQLHKSWINRIKQICKLILFPCII